MKPVTMFKRVCSQGLVLICVLLLIGAPQAADAQSTSTITSDTQAPVDSSALDPVVQDFDSRIRVRQGGTNSAGIYFNQNNGDVDHSFIGASGPTSVGFYGFAGAGWGFLMDTTNGDVTISGKTTTKVLQIIGGADLAETFEIDGAKSIIPGQIVSIDANSSGALRIADTAYDRTVTGVISGAGGINPGLTLQQEGTVAAGAYPVSLTGRVYVWADAEYGSIAPGDLLTTSDTPGHAMKVTDHERAQGAIFGKAMGALKQGKGLVLVLVTLQ